jgi:hypothetical protein
VVLPEPAPESPPLAEEIFAIGVPEDPEGRAGGR